METRAEERMSDAGENVGQGETLRGYEVLLVVTGFLAGLIIGLSMAGIP